MRKRVALTTAVLAILAWGTGAWATLYTGSEGNLNSSTNPVARIDVGGIGTSGNSWMGIVGSTGALSANQGVHFAWAVNDTANLGYWTYTYIFTEGTGVNGKNVVSFSLDFGGSLADVVSQTLIGYSNQNATAGATTLVSQGLFGTYDLLAGNPIEGLQWSLSSGAYKSFSLTLVTRNAPVWGDYTVVGPVAGGDGQTMRAWDLGLASDYPLLAFVDGNDYAGYEYVMTPGGAPVPVPPSVLLLAGGLGGLGFLRRKRVK